MKKLMGDLQGQKATRNDSVVAESLKEELIYLRNENLTKTLCQHKTHQILKNNLTLV